jgi:hypothetical protein
MRSCNATSRLRRLTRRRYKKVGGVSVRLWSLRDIEKARKVLGRHQAWEKKESVRTRDANGWIQRVGEGIISNPYRYFRAVSREAGNRKAKNRILLQMLRGEEPGEEK